MDVLTEAMLLEMSFPSSLSQASSSEVSFSLPHGRRMSSPYECQSMAPMKGPFCLQ